TDICLLRLRIIRTRRPTRCVPALPSLGLAAVAEVRSPRDETQIRLGRGQRPAAAAQPTARGVGPRLFRHTPPASLVFSSEGRDDMIDIESIRAEVGGFGAHYDYDASYLVHLAESSLGAYEAFAAAQGLGQYRWALPLEAHCVAGIAAALSDDCGACGQLGLRMAVEKGVDRALLRTLVETPEALPGPLADVYAHARAVCKGEPDDLARAARLRAAYGAEGVAEL